MNTAAERSATGSPDHSISKGDAAPKQEEDGQALADKAELAQYLTPDHKMNSEIIEGVLSHSSQIQLESANKIRRLMQLMDGPAEVRAQIIIDSGILPSIIDLLSSENSSLASEYAWILVNVSAGTSEQTSAVVGGGAIPKLITLCQPIADEAKNRPLTTLRNILADSSSLRELVIKQGGLEPALDVLENPERYSSKCVDSAAWMIERATSQESDREILLEKTKPMVAILLKFILYQQDDTAESFLSAIKALRSLDSTGEATNRVANSGIIPRLVRLSRCTTENNGVQDDAFRLLSGLMLRRLENIQAALDSGLLDAIQVCIRRPTSVMVACWAACRIASGTTLWVTTLVQSPLISILVEVVFDTALSIKSRQEAAKALSYSTKTMAQSNSQLLEPLLETRCIEGFSEMLSSGDGRVAHLVLLGIESFIQTDWSGQGEAMARFKASDGIRLLREVRAKRWAREGPAAGIAQRMLNTHFPEWSKYPRV